MYMCSVDGAAAPFLEFMPSRIQEQTEAFRAAMSYVRDILRKYGKGEMRVFNNHAFLLLDRKYGKKEFMDFLCFLRQYAGIEDFYDSQNHPIDLEASVK